MKIHMSAGLVSLVLAMGLGAPASFAASGFAPAQAGVQQIQYDRYDQRRDGYNDRDSRGPNDNDRDSRNGAKWRPGEVLPARFLNRVVDDWEERGLSRPPGGHQWVRVGLQFVLVRGRDRMIARILNFD